MPGFIPPSGDPEDWDVKPPGYGQEEKRQDELSQQPAAKLEPSYADIPAWEQRKREEIRNEAGSALVSLTAEYPESEVMSFRVQEQEARAFLADSSATVPLLAAIVQERGISLAELVAKVIAKAAVYTRKAGKIIGRRQYFLDQLAIAKAQAEASGNAKAIADIVVCYNCDESEQGGLTYGVRH